MEVARLHVHGATGACALTSDLLAVSKATLVRAAVKTPAMPIDMTLIDLRMN
jgi:hypothetical protein